MLKAVSSRAEYQLVDANVQGGKRSIFINKYLQCHSTPFNVNGTRSFSLFIWFKLIMGNGYSDILAGEPRHFETFQDGN